MNLQGAIKINSPLAAKMTDRAIMERKRQAEISGHLKWIAVVTAVGFLAGWRLYVLNSKGYCGKETNQHCGERDVLSIALAVSMICVFRLILPTCDLCLKAKRH